MILDIQFDCRLIDARIELDTLEDHLQLVESQIERIQNEIRSKADTYIQKGGFCPSDSDWLMARQECEYRIEQLPRFFRGSFLVALYAVYESTVTEVGRLIQAKQSQGVKISDLKGDFLERAKKYYKHILKFDLYSEERAWQQVKTLSKLRNAFAHANGRLDMVKTGLRDDLQTLGQQKCGISITWDGCVICEENIVADIFDAVRGSLEDLIERYKHWDDQRDVK